MSYIYKIFYIFILLLFNSNLIANNLWIRLNSPTSAALRNCSFVDALNGWAAGDSGIIVHTSNGGNSFEIQNTTIDYYINDIYFINRRIGWAVANKTLLAGSTILKTTNSGNVWTAYDFPDSTKIFRTVFFSDSLNGYLGGFGGAIYKTTDAGNHWSAAVVDTSEFSGFPITKFKFASANTGFACGGYPDVAGIIWRTTNSGASWKADNYSPEPFYNLFVKNAQSIIAVGGDFEYGVQISKTTNAGLSWNYQSLGLFGQAYSIDFRNDKEAWMALGYSRNFAVSYDSGRSWSVIPCTDSSEIYSIDFADSLNGWAVGLNGVILKYSSMTYVNRFANFNSPHSFILYQNYPNPFNPETFINYEIAITTHVKINIFNIQGKEIETLVNEKRDPGKYEVRFNGENLSSGIYYYKIETENFSEVKKMILLK